MKIILGITSEHSQALQMRDQYIINAMSLVKVSKYKFQNMSDDRWTLLIKNFNSFCAKNISHLKYD